LLKIVWNWLHSSLILDQNDILDTYERFSTENEIVIFVFKKRFLSWFWQLWVLLYVVNTFSFLLMILWFWRTKLNQHILTCFFLGWKTLIHNFITIKHKRSVLTVIYMDNVRLFFYWYVLFQALRMCSLIASIFWIFFVRFFLGEKFARVVWDFFFLVINLRLVKKGRAWSQNSFIIIHFMILFMSFTTIKLNLRLKLTNQYFIFLRLQLFVAFFQFFFFQFNS
jgi:hypothetical protein